MWTVRLTTNIYLDIAASNNCRIYIISSVCVPFTKIDLLQGRKASLSEFQRPDGIHRMVSEHNKIKP